MEFAKVKAGHDKDEIYLILKEDDAVVYLVNGKNKTLQAPKKKSKKHISVIKRLPQEVIEILESEKILKDHIIKRAIFVYKKSINLENMEE